MLNCIPFSGRILRCKFWLLTMSVLACLALPQTLSADDHILSSATKATSMHTIQITVGSNVMTAHLEDNAASRDFMALLPLDVELSDYASTEKITDLPKKLSTQGAPSGFDPSVGDITYYAPWGNLAIFYKDFSYSRGLVNLGKITEGLQHLKFSGSKNARIELVSPHN